MINSRLFYTLILLASSFFLSCNSSDKTLDSSTPNFDDAELVQLTPERNELAKLMLIMYAKTEALKTQIKNGKGVIDDSYLQDLKKITKVNNGVDKSRFVDFSEYSGLLSEQALLLKNTTPIQPKAYNNLINSCILCHEQFCPKMVPKIEKLLIK